MLSNSLPTALHESILSSCFGHFLIIVELDLLDDHEVKPVHLICHLTVFKLVLILLKSVEPFCVVHVKLTVFTSFPTLIYTFNGICERLEPLQSFALRCYNTTVGLDESREVAKEWVSRFQEIETRVANLTLCQSLKEVIAILCYELCG